MPGPPPDRFGKYHVLGKLAQGGMAEIFKVKTVGLAGFEKLQVLKKILPAHAQNPRFIRSFIDEARIAVSLNHRNIVQVFEFGRVAGELFLAMELIEGVNLRDVTTATARRHTRPSIPMSSYILAEVASGLDYAHRRKDHGGRPLGIVHCDVSPQNVALSWEGYVKILDFGVARATFVASEKGRLRGKPRYMSPEQTRGDIPTTATDVFALGVVAWELLTGHALFDGPDVDTILKAIQRLDVSDPRELAPEIPTPLAQAVLRALAREPAARGLASDLGAAFAQTQRELDPQLGSRQVARWLADLFLESPLNTQAALPEPEPESDPAPVPTDDGHARGADTGPTHLPGLASLVGASLSTSTSGSVGAGTGSGASTGSSGSLASVPPAGAPAPGGTWSQSGSSSHSRSLSHGGSYTPTLSGSGELGSATTPGFTASPLALAAPELLDEAAAGVPSGSDGLEGEGQEGEPETLDEKRRVVAAATLLSGPGEAIERTLRVLADLAYKDGALVHDDGGDGMVVLFGLEVAGDDDVAAALRFAIDAEEAAREEGVVLRTGVRQAVVRRRQGAGYLVLGDGLEEARLLARAAGAGRALVGGVPGRLAAAGYAFREQPPLKRRGRRVRILELLGPRPRGADAGSPAPSFHGRARELGGLRDAWRAAVEGDVQLACGLVGEAGIGKTRLCGELATWVMAQGGEVVSLSARPLGRAAPLAAVADLAQLELGIPPVEPGRAGRGAAVRVRAAEKAARLAADAGLTAAPTGEMLGALGQALDLAAGGPVPPGGIGRLGERVTTALSTLRALRPAGAPRLTIIEDWHALDLASADVLGQLLAAPQTGAELVVLTARPAALGDAPAWPPTVSPVIRLGDLPRADLVGLIRARVPPGASDLDVAAIERRAGGNPLFAEELALALGELGPGELPETARTVVAARVDRLPRGAKGALQVAAVIGPVFSGRLLEELLGASVQRSLVLLEQTGILTRKRLGEGELAFRHGLLQEVVYESLSGTARREAHRRVGTLLSEHYEAGRTGAPETIARHLELGGDPARAAQFHLRAGRVALLAHDAAGAVQAFGRALELGPGGLEREREALAGREQALGALGDTAGQRRDVEALVKLSAGDPRRQAEALVRASAVHLTAGELDRALEVAAAAERGASDERTRARALVALALTHATRGELEAAHLAALRAVEAAGRLADDATEAAALHAAGRVHTVAGRPGAALETLGAASARARAAGEPRLERACLCALAELELLTGDPGRALAHAREAQAAAYRSGDVLGEAAAAVQVAAVFTSVGRPAEATPWLERALALDSQSGAQLALAEDQAAAGRAALAAGAFDGAVPRLEAARALAGSLGGRELAVRAGVDLVLALVRRRAPGDLGHAEAQAEEAAALAAEVRPAREALARARLAGVLLEAGDPRAALVPANHAVRLLERFGHAEGGDEEVLYVRHLVLAELGDPGAADALARARASLSARLARIEEPDWRTSVGELELSRRIWA